MDPKLRLDGAGVQVLLHFPFFAPALLSVEGGVDVVSRETHPWVETACTDGTKIYFSEEYMEKLSQPELIFDLLHELAHILFGHCWRFGPGGGGCDDMKIANIACDYAVNLFVKEMTDKLSVAQKKLASPIAEMPSGSLYDEKYKDVIEQRIYYEIAECVNSPDTKKKISLGVEEFVKSLDNDGNSQSSVSGQTAGISDCAGGCGGFISLPGSLTAAQKQGVITRFEEALIQGIADQQKKDPYFGAGNLPANLRRIVDSLTKPKVTWQQHLANWVKESLAHDEYNWRKPNKRHMQREIILPTLHSKKMGTIIVAIDTSGSISDKMLVEAVSELNELLSTIKFDKILVYPIDAGIKKPIELDEGGDIREAMRGLTGGGGTSFGPVFEEVIRLRDEENQKIAGLIFFTDLDESGTDQKIYDMVNFPVLWVVLLNRKFLRWRMNINENREKLTPPGGIGEIILYNGDEEI